ncbi:hypothetical protein [Afifella marina]|uniref:DUF2442 domain-containing protein n=1 Tax=Afifella marina DSM 2698 TaxID=1120955 RepID=A0A1G5NQE0_AFIMA|nr:hypothetical protein [Afifella marina]MBK1624572.1 hypothetical protein [Afifella marina DSM 2698]MBK1627465.1 hypothetical protein [Afifella marina]MBK5918523.1 hypothetical protein [Afifella marina]RAI18575.1 hypothetical protein CH311_15405 [Afifella marina DSM 2698]SCZ39011.1 hypothetical protein SAMN03080610_02377 [Afifella marina DSM 2698]
MPRLAAARPLAGLSVAVDWAEGPRRGRSEIIDLSPLIGQFRIYAPLRDDPALFADLVLADEGETLEWDGGRIDMAATSVERLAEEQMTGADFEAFLRRNNLTRHAAAAELGRSLRAIQGYVASQSPIPRVVALACRGFEAGKHAGSSSP